MKTNGNDPANPTEITYVDNVLCGIQTGESSGISIGLTKREQFAMAAMQGLCANYLRDGTPWDLKSYAVDAVDLADELISALNGEV